jgi:hypothetical protein
MKRFVVDVRGFREHRRVFEYEREMTAGEIACCERARESGWEQARKEAEQERRRLAKDALLDRLLDEQEKRDAGA